MLRGVVLIALAAVSWGTTGSVTTVLVTRADVDPWVIGAARMWVAAVMLLAATRATGGASTNMGGLATGPPSPPTLGVAPGNPGRSSKYSARLLGRGRLGVALVLGACMAAFQATYFTAVTMTGITITALVAICSAPVMIAALAVLVLRERLTRRVIVSIALGVAGTALLVANPHTVAPAAPRFALGALLALGAALSYAVYVVVAKAALAHTAPLRLAAMSFTVAAILLTLPLAWIDAPGAQLARGWPWLVYLGAVTTAAAYALYTTGLRYVPATVAGIVSLVEPLTATLLGALVFGERLGPTGVAGALLLFAAVMLSLVGARRA